MPWNRLSSPSHAHSYSRCHCHHPLHPVCIVVYVSPSRLSERNSRARQGERTTDPSSSSKRGGDLCCSSSSPALAQVRWLVDFDEYLPELPGSLQYQNYIYKYVQWKNQKRYRGIASTFIRGFFFQKKCKRQTRHSYSHFTYLLTSCVWSSDHIFSHCFVFAWEGDGDVSVPLVLSLFPFSHAQWQVLSFDSQRRCDQLEGRILSP